MAQPRTVSPWISVVAEIGAAGSKNTVTYAAGTAIRPWLPPRVGAVMERLEQFAMPGRREAWLTAAGFAEVHSELFAWQVPFPDESSLWARDDLAALTISPLRVNRVVLSSVRTEA